jgi:uncharacterized protein
MDISNVGEKTRLWISSIVIGLNLCPFANRVFKAGLIRYVVTEVENEQALLRVLSDELQSLADTPIYEVETTLLIHPLVLRDFLDYNEFLDAVEDRIGAMGLRGVIQVASFHPAYRFAETAPDAIENYTNRSPFPMLHLLREESIAAVAADSDRLLKIPEDNQATLRSLGRDRVLAKLSAITES